MPRDKYTAAIAYFTRHPFAMDDAFAAPHLHEHGCLFAYVTPDGRHHQREDGQQVGCLILIRQLIAVAWTDRLTIRISNDFRIPRNLDDLNQSHLPVLAEWQRKIDRILERS